MKTPFKTMLMIFLCLSFAQAQEAQTVYQNTVSSVFTIVTKDGSGEEMGLGSGFIYGKGNWLVTNYHVIKGATSAIAIPANNQVEYPIAGVLIADAALDVAVLQLKGTFRTQLIGASNMPQVGSKVYALGSPKGLTATFSDGIISAVRTDHLQTTTPISPGSSGGPLLDIWGRVVGMNTKQYAEGQNLNFAVPIATINNVMKNITPNNLLSFTEANEVYNIDEEEKEDEYVSDTEETEENSEAFLLTFGGLQNQHSALLFIKKEAEPVVFVKYKGGMIKESCEFKTEEKDIFRIQCQEPIDMKTGLKSRNYQADTFWVYKQDGIQKVVLTDGTKDRYGKPNVIPVETEKLTEERLLQVANQFLK